MGNSDYSLSDIAAVTGGNRNNSGFGDGSGAWWIVLFLIFAMGGFRNGGFGGGNGGGGMPYIVNSTNDGVQRGFDHSSIINGINTINGNLADLATQACNNRFDVVTAITNGVNGLNNTIMANEMARQNCCCETKQAISDLKYTVATENCADRQALNEGIRDIIANQTASVQAVLDKLCQQEIEAKNDTIANLRTQINMQNLAASQAAQNNLITQGFANEVDALYNRLNACPVPTTPVYGRTPIFTCPNNNGCGCGGNVNFI